MFAGRQGTCAAVRWLRGWRQWSDQSLHSQTDTITSSQQNNNSTYNLNSLSLTLTM